MENGLDKCCAGEPTSGGVPINESDKILRIEYIEKLPSFEELDKEYNETLE